MATDLPVGQRNLYRIFFTGPDELQRLLPDDRERGARAHVADLRATSTRRRGDPAVRRLVEELRRASPLFERLWAEHDVAVRHVDRKRVPHPTVGLLELDCEALLTPEHDQRLILSTAPAGTETAEKLELLRVVGLQQLVPENHPLMADN